jgi:L-threonylcarbamoyladenylate synthase
VPIYRLDTPDHASVIAQAAQLLCSGELVAFPTETVYGLGANALNADAVEKIFLAKGRPSYNPLIVHVENADAARALALTWPAAAEKLASTFWPGPLSLVIPKKEHIPDIVTAGLRSVALRAPAHPVARELLRACGLPLAAPSANLFTELSPTTAAHVEAALGERVSMILDGGMCNVGIESTVLDLTGPVPVLLRPGTISLEALQTVVGNIIVPTREDKGESPRPSPGMIERHYAPRARLIMLSEEMGNTDITDKTGALLWSDLFHNGARSFDKVIVMPTDSAGYAQRLYGALHELDNSGCSVIYVEPVPVDSSWSGIRDRLSRATKAKN